MGKPTVHTPHRPRPPVYGPEVIAGLRMCWAVLGAPTGKRLAPVLPDLVAPRGRDIAVPSAAPPTTSAWLRAA